MLPRGLSILTCTGAACTGPVPRLHPVCTGPAVRYLRTDGPLRTHRKKTSGQASQQPASGLPVCAPAHLPYIPGLYRSCLYRACASSASRLHRACLCAQAVPSATGPVPAVEADRYTRPVLHRAGGWPWWQSSVHAGPVPPVCRVPSGLFRQRSGSPASAGFRTMPIRCQPRRVRRTVCVCRTACCAAQPVFRSLWCPAACDQRAALRPPVRIWPSCLRRPFRYAARAGPERPVPPAVMAVRPG